MMASAMIPQLNAAAPANGGEAAPGGRATSQSQEPGGMGTDGQSQHKRVYQACLGCRERKVKCDLGPVDAPHDPPCVRCRRESKECVFARTRRKPKVDADGRALLDDGFVARNSRKRDYTSHSGSPEFETRGPYSASAGTARNSIDFQKHYGVRSTPLKPPAPGYANKRKSEDANVLVENPEAQQVMRKEVYGPHDAMDLLFRAAQQDDSREKRHKSNASAPSLQHRESQSSYTTRVSYASITDTPRTMPAPPPRPYAHETEEREQATLNVSSTEESDRQEDPGYQSAIKAWSRFRFVRAGWFTPQEAIDYIDYYYKYLSPLTPISPPTFRNPATHLTLLQDEPILTVTLLTIASRYLEIQTTGGKCRSAAIHDQLWNYLRGMIERCLWGQESFGGGFRGQGGSEKWAETSSTAPWRGMRKGSLRTLGTVESLMILTEWHPRALHFPPQEATDELMLPSYEAPDTFSVDEDEERRMPGGIGGKRIESWLEPAWRSDRMCWMLLSTALGLSYELGVFDDMEAMKEAGADRPEEMLEINYVQRSSRIRRLLLIYLTQLAGRLGWTNMVPEQLRLFDGTEIRKRMMVENADTPGTSSSISAGFNYIPNLELDDRIIHCWAGITIVMRTGNEKIFRSRAYTTEIIANGRYLELLREFQPHISAWKQSFDQCVLPNFIRHILTIEYEYVRIYINSLALQAVVERGTNMAMGKSGQDASPHTQNLLNKLPITHLGGFSQGDKEYVNQVVEGSRNLLRTVVEGLLPNNYLKHAPVRTYFRIISGAMFLLKTFALGASKSDVETSIGLMDRAVEALRDCVVDDVHLGTRFADMLETLTRRLRHRFMQAPVSSETGATSRDEIEGQAGNGLSGVQQSVEGGKMEPPQQGQGSWSLPAIGDGSNMSDSSNTISATTFDLGPNAFYNHNLGAQQNQNSLHPPTSLQPGASPNSGNLTFDATNRNGIAGWQQPMDPNDMNADMWYLPTNLNLFQNADQGITQTADGLGIGGADLIDWMTMDFQEFAQ